MNRTITLLALAVTLLACDQKAKQESQPAPKPAEPVPAPAPGGVAPTDRRAANADCLELKLGITKEKVTYARERSGEIVHAGGAIDAAAFENVLRTLAGKCVGPAALTVDDAVSYQDVVHVMDLAIKVGFTAIAIEGGPGPTAAAAAVPPAGPDPRDPDSLKNAPIVIVSKTAITIGTTELALDDPQLQKSIQDTLAARKAGGGPAGMLVLQADQGSSGKVLNAVVRGAKDAGYDNLLFAVKKQ